MTSKAFMDLPTCKINISNSKILSAALDYSKEHTSEATVNHCMRSAAFAVLISGKLPHLGGVDKELVMLSCIFHDLGWATTKSLISDDKRFEVDGANAARAWVNEHGSDLKWDQYQIQLCWDAIALHATPSISMHKQAEVAATNLGITADFVGSNLPHNMVSIEEQLEIVKAYPRLGFSDHVVGIMCGLCKNKPETTFDNFVSEFGVRFGYDGQGAGKEEFAKKLEEGLIINKLMGALKACEETEKAKLDL